jgi:hypothetical protein
MFSGTDEWPNIFDEANETVLASIMIYALADLRTLARKGLLAAPEEQPALVDRILTLPISTREIVRLVVKNRDAILEQIGKTSMDLYLSAFDSIQETVSRLEVCPETGETTLVSSDVVTCDDEHSDTELVYGIWINSARKRITVTFRGCTTRKDWSMAASPFLQDLPNPAFHRDKEADGSSCPETIAIHYGFYHYLNHPSTTIPWIQSEYYRAFSGWSTCNCVCKSIIIYNALLYFYCIM